MKHLFQFSLLFRSVAHAVWRLAATCTTQTICLNQPTTTPPVSWNLPHSSSYRLLPFQFLTSSGGPWDYMATCDLAFDGSALVSKAEYTFLQTCYISNWTIIFRHWTSDKFFIEMCVHSFSTKLGSLFFKLSCPPKPDYVSELFILSRNIKIPYVAIIVKFGKRHFKENKVEQ